MTDTTRNAGLLADLSTDMADAADGDDVQVVVERAVATIGPCEHGSMTLRDSRGRFTTVASTSAVASRADELQYAHGEGPCVDAASLDEVCLLDDVRTDTRWPRWSAEIADLGLHSVLSIRLGTTTTQVGALNLFASRPSVFTLEDVDLAAAYAVIAGNAMHTARRVHHLESALTSRHSIGVAQGVLMARYDLPMEAAFALLQRYSSHSNTKLRDIAAYVALHRRLPDDHVALLQDESPG